MYIKLDQIGSKWHGFYNNDIVSDLHDKHGLNKHGLDKHGLDEHGLDKQGLDKHGFDKHGFDKHGFDKHGFDKHGLDKHGIDKHFLTWSRQTFFWHGLDKYFLTWKSVQIRMVDWMGRNFDVFPGFQEIPCYA